MTAQDDTPAQVEAVIFDWGGTLSHWALVEFDGIWQMAARHLAPHMAEDEEQLRQRLARVELEAWDRMNDDPDHRSFTFRDLVDRASAELGVDVADALIEEATDHYLDAWVPHIEHDEDAAHVLATLRGQGIKTGLLSNTHWPAPFHERMLERDGLAHLLDARVYTSDLPHVKPHRSVFEAALAAVGVQDASRAVYVGDRLFDDIHGAQQAGLRAVHRPNPHVPDYDATPDATIETLSDLLPHIERWRNGGFSNGERGR